MTTCQHAYKYEHHFGRLCVSCGAPRMEHTLGVVSSPELVSVVWVARASVHGCIEEHIFATKEEATRFALDHGPFGEPIFQRIDHTMEMR